MHNMTFKEIAKRISPIRAEKTDVWYVEEQIYKIMAKIFHRLVKDKNVSPFDTLWIMVEVFDEEPAWLLKVLRKDRLCSKYLTIDCIMNR